jgi:hypothetical protein
MRRNNMLYYRITSKRDGIESESGSSERHEFEKEMRRYTREVNCDDQPMHVCIAHIRDEMLECPAMAKEYVVSEEALIERFHELSALCGFGMHKATVKEITFREYSRI